MKKSVTKRIRVTRTGKMVRRSMGLDHFRARQATKTLRLKRVNTVVNASDRKNIMNEASRYGI